ncbi:MAG: pyridoxamine 5'-phosphate oxidase family protein [Myxococcota bacterium]
MRGAGATKRAAHTVAGLDSPFHEGELRIQSRLEVRDRLAPWARRVIRDHLPTEHAEFYAGLPFVVAAGRDEQGRPFATLLAGRPGFVRADDARSLSIASRPVRGDALAAGFGPGSDVGLLGIESHTRRRNRANGRVRRQGAGGLELAVDQTFGNCPQHIRPRRAVYDAGVAPEGASGRGSPRAGADRTRQLSPAQRRWIGSADTFFLATGHRGVGDHPSFGMDASHRGGPPGFVDVLDEGRLRFPDYAGNDYFNSLGNLALDDRAGLLFVDFERGRLLQLTGRARVDWRSPDPDRFPGARRLVDFRVEEVVEPVDRVALRWVPGEDVERTMQVLRRERESEDVVSFHLAPVDEGEGPPPSLAWRAGQHLPLGVELGGAGGVAWRSYSISNAPGASSLRISVKREARGLVSRRLHDAIREGDRVRVRPPAGDFVLDAETATSARPLCLVGAGIGITPLAAMLHAAADAGGLRSLVLVHGVRDGARHPLARELRHRIAALPQARLHVRYSAPRREDAPGRDYDSVGRIDVALLERLVPGLDACFRLCGPAGFLADLESGLLARGVPLDAIAYERF